MPLSATIFSHTFLRFLPTAIFVLLLGISTCWTAQHGHAFAQGNLFTVFQPKSGRTSDHSPQMYNLSALWCQATYGDGEDQLPIKEAKFVRTLPKPEKVHEASRFSSNRKRAYLDFGLVSIHAIGKYRCEIITEQDELVTGNLFVYMRPVLLFNSSTRLDPAEENNAFAWVGSPNKAYAGDDVVLNCPAIGYPLPEIRWFKEGAQINTSAVLADENGGGDRRKYLLTAHSLYIRTVDDKDEGNYRCVARNSFALEVDSSVREFTTSLDQQLRVMTSLSWILPLLVIVVCLVLLVLIIWSCSKWKRYRHTKHYNVAKKERELGQQIGDGEEGQRRLPLELDDLED